ncbi:MAG TPA: translocation/assembly module TamB domain-containing protein [Candidatus Eisenbacteria bacterium]
MFGGEIERIQSEKQQGKPGPPRRRVPVWLSRILIFVAAVLLIVCVVAGIFALLFARGDPVVSRRIVRFISTSIGSDSTRLESDRIHGSVFGGAVLERPRLVVLTPDGPVTWLSAKRLRAEYDSYQLLFSRRRTLRITIDSPVLPLVHDKRGNLVVPRFRGSKRNPLDKTATRIDVVFRDGTISLDRGGARFGKISGTAAAILEPAKTTMRVTRISGVSLMPGRPGRIRADGVATVADGRLRFDPLYVALDRSRIRSAIDWDLEHARVVSSRTGVAPLDVEEVMRFLDLTPATRGSLVGEISFAGDPSSGNAVVRLAGTIEGEPVDTLFVRAAFVPGAIHIDDGRARVRQAEVQGRAVIETRGVLTAEANLKNVDPALLPWWRLPANTPHGRLSGTARIRAVRAKPYPVAAMSVALERGTLGRLRIDRGAVSARLGQRGDIGIDTAWVDTPGARLLGSGRIAPDTTLAFSFEALVRDLGAMDSLLKPVSLEAGQGRVTGSIRGRSPSPDYQLQGVLTSGRLSNGMAFDSLAVASRGRLGSSRSATAELAVTGLRAGERSLGDGVSTVAITDRVTIQRFRQSFGDTTISLRGDVRVRGRIAAATLDSLTVAVGAREWKNMGPVEATLEGDRIEIQRLSLAMDSGRLDVAGSVWLESNRVDARAAFQNVDLNRTLGPGNSPDAPRGIADGDLLVAGPLEDPEIQVNLRVGRPRVGGVDGDSLTMALSYAPGLVSVSEIRWVAGSGSATLAGTARPRIGFQEWMRSLSRRDRAWTSRVDLALGVSANALDLRTLAPIDTSLSSLRGVATGTVRITGTPEEPALVIQARGSGVAFHGVDADSAEFSGTYAHRKLTIGRLEFRRAAATTHVEGFLPIDLSLYGGHRVLREQPVALKLRMVEADFGVAALFVPEFASSAGKLNVSADLQGTPARPILTGSLRLTDGILRIAGRDEVLEGLEVDASFDQHRVNVTRIAAREGKRGRLTGTGWWQTAEGKRWGDYEFRLHATEFTATDRETYMFRFSGDFRVQDAVNPSGSEVYRITNAAPAILSRGELTMDLSRPREEADAPRSFLYDIIIDVPRNLWYRNLDTEVELMNGQLRLRNEGYRDLILGSLEVKGKYYIYSNEFRITSGAINFTSLDRIDPDISIEAQTTLPGQGADTYPIYQTLSGRASQLKVHLHDDAGHNESYLWKVLTIGQFTAAGSEVGRTDGLAPAAGDATLPVRNYLFRNAERWLADVGFIDTIDLKSGTATGTSPSAGTIGLLGIGKYVTPELYVKYSRNFSGTAEQIQSLSAEYRVTRHLLLRGEQVRPGPGNTIVSGASQALGKEQYNLDLKVRLEY